MVLCYFSNYFYTIISIIKSFRIKQQKEQVQIILSIYLYLIILLLRNKDWKVNFVLIYQIIIKFYVFILV